MNNYSLALNPFKKGKKAEVESVKLSQVEICSDLEKAINQYKALKPGEIFHYYRGVFDTIEKVILSPPKISYFVNYVFSNNLLKNEGYEETDIFFNTPTGNIISEKKGYGLTGIYLTRLIQDSYDAGHNNFLIDLPSVINNVASKLKGKKGDLLNVTIRGDIKGGAKNLDYCQINLEGNADYFAFKSKNSHFHIEGDLKHDSGYELEDCNFYINGNVGSIAKKAKSSSFVIDGDIKSTSAFGAKNSEIYVSGNVDTFMVFCGHDLVINVVNEESYHGIIKKGIGKSNKLYLVNEKGEILEEYKRKKDEQ